MVPGRDTPRYAGFWIRLVAGILDIAFLWISEVALVGGAWEIGLLPMTEKELGEGLGAIMAVLLPVFPAWPYFAILECSKAQGTVGKRLLGLRVTDLDDGDRIGFGRASARYWAKLVCLPFFAGFIPIAFSPRKQGLHDRIANTLVVRQRGRARPGIQDADDEEGRIES